VTDRMTPDHLFVYGTLRRDSGHEAHAILAAGASLVGRAKVRGTLYKLGWHPGAVLTTQEGAWIQGELYWLHDAPMMLAVLDDYEGCAPGDPEPHRFARVAVEVVLEDGAVVPSWIYVFRESTDGATRIESGDWMKMA
jgi:pyruvate carboxylase